MRRTIRVGLSIAVGSLLSGCAGPTIVGTWVSTNVDPTAQSRGVVSASTAYTFGETETLTVVLSTTRGSTAMSHAGCTETVNATGSYHLRDAATISMSVTAATLTRSGCTNDADNAATAPLDATSMTFLQAGIGLFDTYVIHADTLTLAAGGIEADGGTSAAGRLVLTRR